MNTTAAVYYEEDAYGTAGKRLLGRQAAGEGFLRGLVRSGKAEPLFCCARTRKIFDAFCRQVTPWSATPRKIVWLPAHDLPGLARAGTLYRPDPNIGELAWQRRFHDQRAYSLCGVTHTIAGKQMQQMIGDLMLSPVQPWDAVICASKAVKQAYEKILEDWGGYLEQRIGTRPVNPVQLPVIPLGIDCGSFPQGEQADQVRAAFRRRMGIAPEDIVVFFMGRLIFYGKAHPVPMYQALERAARVSGRRIHLIQAGWFENKQEEEAFLKSPADFCPSVRCLFLDGRRPEVRYGLWPAADIFVSLSDNIQETFGLTPIEAMANGLPVVLADWNGYRELMHDGVEGFKIPVTMPSPGAGRDLAEDYLINRSNYSAYIAHPCMATAVDIEACAHAFVTLIEQPDLRKKMGEAGRQRARNVYDWNNIIPAYERLWENLAELRQGMDEVVPGPAGSAPHPLCQDPFAMFSHYTPLHLHEQSLFLLSPNCTPALRQALAADWMTQYGGNKRLPVAAVDELLVLLSPSEPVSARTLLEQLAQRQGVVPSNAHFFRTLGYLLKFDLIRNVLK